MVVRVEDTFQYYRIVDNYYYQLVEVSYHLLFLFYSIFISSVSKKKSIYSYCEQALRSSLSSSFVVVVQNH